MKRFCAVPLREHVKFSRATSVFSVVGIENARSNRPSTTAWRPAPSCGMSRAPRRLPVLSFPRRDSLETRRGFPESRWQQNQVSLVFFIFWSKGLSRKGRRRQPTSAPPRTRRRVTCDGKRDRQTMEMTTSLDSAMRVPERHRRDILRYFEGSRATSFPHDTSARHDDAYTFLPRRAGRSLLFFCRYASRDVLRSSSLLPPPDS